MVVSKFENCRPNLISETRSLTLSFGDEGYFCVALLSRFACSKRNLDQFIKEQGSEFKNDFYYVIFSRSVSA